MKTTSFTHLDDAEQASCLCYSGSIWAPNLFDGYESGCIAWASTADTSELPGFIAAAGLCEEVGNVRSATVTATETAELGKLAASMPPSAASVSTIPAATSSLTSATATPACHR